MKFINYLYCGEKNIGILEGEYIYKTEFNDLYALMEAFDVSELKSISKGDKIALNEVKMLPIIEYPRQDVLCAGMNYKTHRMECISASIDNSKATDTPHSVYFSKRCNKANTNGDVIPLHEDITSEVDYEGELGVIFGRDAKDIKTDEEALSVVFGYTVIDDVSARDLQKEHQQFYFGKSLDGFFSIAPILVTRDEFEGFPDLNLRTYVNGELRQNNLTDNMIFPIPYMIKELTSGMTLKRGTIFSTGTPNGIGKAFNPPKMLKKGDEVRVEIEGICSLTNLFE